MRETLIPSENPTHSNDPVQLELFRSTKLYGCHSQVTPNRLTTIKDGEIITSHIVQDGYIAPHPLLADSVDSECNRKHNFVRIESRWMNVRCGYLHKATDKACDGCECLPLPIANKRV